MDPSTGVALFSAAYQFVKDLLDASREDRTARLSAGQLDLTLEELRRKCGFAVEDLAREHQQESAKIKVDFIDRGLGSSSVVEAHLRACDQKYIRLQDNLRAELKYAEQMIELERQKLVGK